MSQPPEPSDIPAGTPVRAGQADIGDKDIARPVVADVEPHPETGNQALVVEKGGLFKKRLIVPAERISRAKDGQVVIDLGEAEAANLSPFGTSVVPPRERSARDYMGNAIADPPASDKDEADKQWARSPEARRAMTAGAILRTLGPGVIAGASDNDPTTVGTLAVVGSQTSFSLAWLLVLVLPMMASVQAIAGAVGATTGQNLQQLIRQRYGRLWTWVALALLLSVNLFTLVADLEGGAAALGIILHVDWRWLTVPLALIVAVALFFGSYEVIRRILTAVLFVFLLYLPAAFLAHPDWGAVLHGTLIPQLSLKRDAIAGTLAILGTTLTSYVFYWQTIEEVEQPTRRPRLLAMLDAGSGMAVATAVFWFILVTTGATLGAHHQTVHSAQDAAGALKPVAGPLAQYLFAGGLLASALLALPALAGTTAYAVGDTLGWPVGLSKQPWRSQGFYIVLVGSLVLVAPITLLGVEPITLLFVSGIIGGIGTPLLLVLLLRIAGDKATLRGNPLPGWILACGWITTAVIVLATGAFLVTQFL